MLVVDESHRGFRQFHFNSGQSKGKGLLKILLAWMMLLLLPGCADWTPAPDADGNDNMPTTPAREDTGRESKPDACPDDPDKTEPGICGCGMSDTERHDWYPDCDGDGGFDSAPVLACGSAGADVAFDCADGSNPRGGWSDTPGDDCDDGDPSSPCPCDEQDRDRDGVCGPFGSLLSAEGLDTGVHDFELRSGTYSLYVDNDHTSGGWVLVGRGRNSWRWNEEGFGNQDNLTVGLGTPAAFSPVYLPTAVVAEIIDNTKITLTSVEIRVKRAADPAGAAYQETLWISKENPDWTWLLDTTPYAVENHVVDSVLGTGASAEADTRDVGYPPNDHRRTFTWAWENHNSSRGFSYGDAVTGGTNDPTNFFWQYGSEGHAIPYSEVYLRYRRFMQNCRAILDSYPSAADGAYLIDPDGDGGGSPRVVNCDMKGGGWMVVHQQDFSSGSSSGWGDSLGNPSPVDTRSDCAEFYSNMLGGYGYFGVGALTEQTFDLADLPHTEVAIDLDYIVIDSWDSEDAIVKVDGEEQYRATMGGAGDLSDTCGSDWNERGPQKVSLGLTHSAPSLTVQITSELDSGPTDEAFGVDNIWIRIR